MGLPGGGGGVLFLRRRGFWCFGRWSRYDFVGCGFVTLVERFREELMISAGYDRMRTLPVPQEKERIRRAKNFRPLEKALAP